MAEEVTVFTDNFLIQQKLLCLYIFVNLNIFLLKANISLYYRATWSWLETTKGSYWIFT